MLRPFSKFEEKDGELLSEGFYNDSNILKVAKALLGKVLVTNFDEMTSGVITEVEAYKAPEDKASHAYNDRRTARTEVMFAPGGLAYVYLCYGIHHMFNVVSGKKDEAHAILVRAVEPLDGLDLMNVRRGSPDKKYRLTSGPGSMAKALGIHTSQSGLNLLQKKKIWLEDRGIVIPDDQVITTSRIGIDYAEEWAEKPWRFILKDSPWVSCRIK